MKITAQLVKELREKTKTSISDCKEALEKSNGDIAQASKYLQEKGAEILEKKKDRKTQNGIVTSYIHSDKKIGVLLELVCETDFVAKTEDFQNLAKELAMQIAATDPKNVEELLKQQYIRDEKMVVKDLVQIAVSKLKENIKINQFCRYQI